VLLPLKLKVGLLFMTEVRLLAKVATSLLGRSELSVPDSLDELAIGGIKT